MSKYKSKKGTPEVHSARSKLDGVLQDLVEKKDDSPTIKEEPLSDQDRDPEPASNSAPNTPTKRGGSSSKQSRKRRKLGGRDDFGAAEMGQYHHTYVMKLFDRSVDLAQFDEETPLYPICRAWMRNQPHNRNLAPRERSPTPEPQHTDTDDEEEYEMQEIYHLPSPLPIKLEPGAEDHDIRIPSPVPQPDEVLDVNADPNTAPAPEQLLLNHMARWKDVRQKWKESGRKNEARYIDSLQQLRDMFDQQCKDQ